MVSLVLWYRQKNGDIKKVYEEKLAEKIYRSFNYFGCSKQNIVFDRLHSK